jgi:hypothetical protein
MQRKITTGVVMTPDVHRRLKLLAARRGRTIGDALGALVSFEELARQIGDPQKRAFVNSVLDALFTGVKVGWGDDPDELIC